MERRVAKRFAIQRDATVDGSHALVANVSQSGAYVLLDQHRCVGDRVELCFRTESLDGPLDWECLGTVRRVSIRGGLGVEVQALTVSDPYLLLND